MAAQRLRLLACRPRLLTRLPPSTPPPCRASRSRSTTSTATCRLRPRCADPPPVAGCAQAARAPRPPPCSRPAVPCVALPRSVTTGLIGAVHACLTLWQGGCSMRASVRVLTPCRRQATPRLASPHAHPLVRVCVQVVLVSATLPHEVLEMTHKFMTDPVSPPSTAREAVQTSTLPAREGQRGAPGQDGGGTALPSMAAAARCLHTCSRPASAPHQLLCACHTHAPEQRAVLPSASPLLAPGAHPGQAR